jgi:hypothetical protein
MNAMARSALASSMVSSVPSGVNIGEPPSWL